MSFLFRALEQRLVSQLMAFALSLIQVRHEIYTRLLSRDQQHTVIRKSKRDEP